MTGLFILLFAGLAAVGWWRLMQGKEAARRAAGLTCRHHGFGDPVRAWGLRYRFEFAHRGILHSGGTVLIAPGRRPTVIIETDNGQLIEQPQPQGGSGLT